MSGINKVMLTGHAGKGQELRYIGADVAITAFPQITSELLIKTGVESAHTEWNNIVMTRGIAEHTFKVVKKAN